MVPVPFVQRFSLYDPLPFVPILTWLLFFRWQQRVHFLHLGVVPRLLRLICMFLEPKLLTQLFLGGYLLLK